MKIDELNIFLNEMLNSSEYFSPKNPSIIAFVKSLDPQEIFWHVEGITIWPIKNWERSIEFREIRRAKERESNAKIEELKQILEKLKDSIVDQLGIPADVAMLLAVEFNKKNPGAAKYFGVDTTQAPKLDKPHLIVNNGKYVDIGGGK